MKKLPVILTFTQFKVKTRGKFFKNFVAFSENLNFTKFIFSDDLFLLSIPTQFACQLPGHAAFQLTYKWSPSCQKHRIGKLLYSYHHENIYRYTKILREKFSVSTHFTTLRVHLCKTKLNLAFFLNQSWCDRIKGCQPKKPIYINLVHFFMSMIYEEV